MYTTQGYVFEKKRIEIPITNSERGELVTFVIVQDANADYQTITKFYFTNT